MYFSNIVLRIRTKNLENKKNSNEKPKTKRTPQRTKRRARNRTQKCKLFCPGQLFFWRARCSVLFAALQSCIRKRTLLQQLICSPAQRHVLCQKTSKKPNLTKTIPDSTSKVLLSERFVKNVFNRHWFDLVDIAVSVFFRNQIGAKKLNRAFLEEIAFEDDFLALFLCTTLATYLLIHFFSDRTCQLVGGVREKNKKKPNIPRSHVKSYRVWINEVVCTKTEVSAKKHNVIRDLKSQNVSCEVGMSERANNRRNRRIPKGSLALIKAG